MPRLTYSPEGLEPTVWEFDFDNLLMPECIAIAKASGLEFSEFPMAFLKYDPAVVYATFQVLAKRAGKDGKALQPRAGELKPEILPDEARVWLDTVLEDAGTDRALWDDGIAGAITMLARMAKVDLADLLEPAAAEDDDAIELDAGDDEGDPEPEAPKA